MHISSLVVEVRDKELTRLGQIPQSDLNLLMEDQFNNVGSWVLQLRPDHEMAEALRTPGAGIIVSDHDGVTIMSGPAVLCRLESTVTEPEGVLTVEGLTDTVILADRLAFPDPSNVDPETQALSHDVRTGSPESLMHAYVNANIGPGAPTARRDTRITMGTNSNLGTSLTKRARFNGLGNLLAELALTAALGFRLIQVGSSLEFQTYAVGDKTADVRFDIRNNMLSGHSVSIAPPSATRAVVAGQGEMVQRQFTEVTTTESVAAEALWGRRIELFVDQRQSDNLDEHTRAGLEALEEGGFSQLGIKVVPMEDVGIAEFGHEWKIGDTVTVVVENVEFDVLVTGYVLKLDKDGFRFGAILGDPNTASPAREVTARVTKLEGRVSNLERNSESGSTATGSNGTLVWNGSAYVDAPDARHYVGPADPTSLGTVADGSIWDEVAI